MSRSILLQAILTLVAVYVLLCGSLFFAQEKLLFFPDVLPASYVFDFPGFHREVWLTMKNGTR
ncbi:MAG: alpha/beta hydrolase, partial [Akkermansiaceae bacterium]|nr:alpha/beta hydrolase [Armatimonadota bacterium]